MKIVIVGNCQVRPLVTILGAMCSEGTRFEYLVAHLSDSCSVSQDNLHLSEADLIFTQPIDDAYKAEHLSTTKLKTNYGKKVVVWPNIFFSGQCPDLVTVTDQQGTVIKGPLETYQLSGVLSTWKQGFSTDQAVKFLRNNLPHDEHALAIGIKNSLQALKQRELSTDINISDFLESEFIFHRLFFTFNHPTLTVMIELCQRLLRFCDLQIEKRVIAQFWEEPLGRLTYPMTAPIAEFLKIKFDFTDACRGVNLEITDKNVKLGQSRLYSFEEFVSESFKAYDAQLSIDSTLRCTPQYLSNQIDQAHKHAAA